MTSDGPASLEPAEAPPPLRDAHRSPRGDVLRTPFRGGAAVGFALLVLAAAAISWAEGGASEDARLGRQMLQAIVLLASVGILGIYAHRIVLCTIEGDRHVPWGSDPLDRTTWMQDVGAFAAVLVMSLLPAIVLVGATRVSGAPEWVVYVAATLGLAAGVAHLPLAVASSVLRDGPMGAGWGGSVRAWRRAAAAARTTVVPAAVFLGLVAVSFLVARKLVPPLASGKVEQDETTARNVGRAVVFALRFGSVWAAFCTFRVAGLVARDVPEIREVLE